MAASAPLSAANFSVVIDGIDVGFCEVSRLTSDGSPPSVVLRRALTTAKELYRWYERAAGKERDVRDVAINQHAAPGGPVVNSWVLERAWPCRWSGPELNALDGGMAYEELELRYERLLWLDEPRRAEQSRRDSSWRSFATRRTRSSTS